MKKFKGNKKSGFTLVEILLVVGFIALAGIGIYTIYNKVQMSNAALTEGKNLDTIRAGVKGLFAGRNNYTLITNQILNDARVTPDSMRAVPYVAGDGTITNSFGGAVILLPNSINGFDNAFTVIYQNVPGAVCSKLATSAGINWDEVVIYSPGPTVVKAYGQSNIDVGAVAFSCASDTGNGVEMRLTSM